ncbi:U11/U12 small nuclear ribonucleoprotein 25 kDa protein isoform X1 [Amborella trichopoda]|uniref:U11/U12 small nuclear ribonucleoprotein 25 kDa protein isoform X1 n=1 Tax=Amborella trichopoda TaxID=13333 RepID=UPI0009BEB624|nr:U11/U12 small nuclear ribonucleoprotein 25 kDa protein isoform X1 [Amborella trichopoda]|eukprot:XP_020517336.1 U11/U12 small nuclear ribonucleoprotein 25 kDa protein isoform X1 [Amborella trichopoda]
MSSKGEDIGGYGASKAKKARLQSMLNALLDDPILRDVPKDPTLNDVDTLISLEMGSAMKIIVVKMDNTSFDVAVMNTATLKDLKLAIVKKTNEMEQGQMGHRHISWRHVWSNFCLSHHNEKLLDDNSILHDFGVRNNSQGIAEALSKEKAQILSWSQQAAMTSISLAFVPWKDFQHDQ